MDAAVDLTLVRHAQELAGTWQAKILRAAEGQLAAVVLSVLAHNYDEAMPTLLRVVFPGFKTITTPFFCSAGKIAWTGHICADMVTRDGQIVKMAAIFRNTRQMERKFRVLADQVKLTDAERVEMFDAVKRWVVCDFRLDPTMDPADPDAKKRLAVH